MMSDQIINDTIWNATCCLGLVDCFLITNVYIGYYLIGLFKNKPVMTYQIVAFESA